MHRLCFAGRVLGLVQEQGEAETNTEWFSEVLMRGDEKLFDLRTRE